MALVYKITNKINGKIYIGETTRTLEQRWKEHCLHAKNYENGSLLYAAIRKYGEDNFIKEVIEDNIPEDIIFEVEASYIIDYNSNDETVGYNNTLNEKNDIVYIKDEKIIKKIIDLLKNTNMSFKDIGRATNINTGIIKSISYGKSYIIKGENYPIRPINKRLDKNIVLEVAKYLKYTRLSVKRISEFSLCEENTVRNIDNGNSYSKVLSSEGYTFPIRKCEQIRIINRDNEIIDNIYNALLDTNMYKTIADISRVYGLNNVTINRINNGSKYKDIILKKFPDTIFPIRKISYSKKMNDKDLFEVLELMLYTSLTQNQILEVMSLQNIECTGSLHRINNGTRYHERIKKLIPNIKFPLRDNKNKRIIFTNKEDIIKENEILKKYFINIDELSIPHGEKHYIPE